MNKKRIFWFLLSMFGLLFLCSSEANARWTTTSTEYEHIRFSANKWTITLNGCGASVGDACLDSFPGYTSNLITQTYRQRTVTYYWDTYRNYECTRYDKYGYCTKWSPYDVDYVYDIRYGSWSTHTTSSYGVLIQTPRPGIPERYNGNMGTALWQHRSYFTDPGGWYGSAPRIADSETKIGYSAWAKQVEALYIHNGQGGQWTYEYQNPAYPVCTKRYGNEVVRDCGYYGTNPGLYGTVTEGSVYNHTYIKVFYYYKDPYTYVTEDTKGTKIGSITDNYTTRWWLQDVAIQGTSKYASIDRISPYTAPASFWEIYGGEKRQFRCYAYFYTDPRDSGQERIDITDSYEHSWRTNKSGVQGAFIADASKPNEGDSYFDRDTRWIGNGRYNVTYKNPRANNSSLYWNWQNDSSRILAPSGDFKENTRETTDRKHPLDNRGQYYVLDVLYNGGQQLNCDMDISWYKSGNIPYLLSPSTAYRDLTLYGSAPHRNIKRNPQSLTIHGVKDIDLLISGTFYKHTTRDEKGTDEVIVYQRRSGKLADTSAIKNVDGSQKGVGQVKNEPLRIENPSSGAVPAELKDLYFMKGQWYSFEIEVEYHNGEKKILNALPEAHWTVDPWILGRQDKYKKETNNQQGTLRTMMPYNGLEHQIASLGTHNLHFEWFDNVNPSNGKTKFDLQFKAAEIESLDIYNEKNELGPTKLNTGDTHQFKAIMKFNAGNNTTFFYDWTNYMNLWGVDDYTVEKVKSGGKEVPGKFLFPKEKTIYGEHKRAGTETERVERVIFAVWFDDILNYVNFTNRNTTATDPMTIYNVSEHWDAFGDMHIVQLKDDCSNIEIYVEKCPLPKSSWRINVMDLTPMNYATGQSDRYTDNPYFYSFDFPVTGTSNGVGRN